MKYNRNDRAQEVINAWQTASSISSLSKTVFGYTNPNTYKKIKDIASKNQLDFDALEKRGELARRRYNRITKTCPSCQEDFITTNGPNEKATCSHACANTHFRSGPNHARWNEEAYASTCFLKHKKECVVCGEDKVVDVHHYDGNNQNNTYQNLIPLCPTHHRYWHSKHIDLIKQQVDDYRNDFIANNI